MRANRVTLRQASAALYAAADGWLRMRPRSPLTVPHIDVVTLFAGRKSITWGCLVDAVLNAIDEANA